MSSSLVIKGFRPQVKSIIGLNQLGGDPDLVTGFSDRAFQYVGDAEHLADFSQILIFVLERERRSSTHDAEAFYLGQRIEYLF